MHNYLPGGPWVVEIRNVPGSAGLAEGSCVGLLGSVVVVEGVATTGKLGRATLLRTSSSDSSDSSACSGSGLSGVCVVLEVVSVGSTDVVATVVVVVVLVVGSTVPLLAAVVVPSGRNPSSSPTAKDSSCSLVHLNSKPRNFILNLPFLNFWGWKLTFGTQLVKASRAEL